MKSGLTIVEMAQQIERQSKLKQDYLLDTRRLQVEPFGSQLYLHTFDDHAVTAYQPIDQRLDVDGTQSNFTIADDNTGLHDVTGYNFGFKPLVDYLDVHTAVRDLAAFKIGVLHLLNDREDDFCNVQIINAAIAVT